MRPSPVRTTRRLSRRMTSVSRGSRPSSSASCRARADGVTLESRTTRPSDFETIFWLMTSMSRSRRGVPCRAAASTMSRATSSPRTISGSASTPMTSYLGGDTLRAGAEASGKVPLAQELGAPGLGAPGEKQREVLWGVDVETEAGKTQNGRRQSPLPRRFEVIVERRFSELERHDVGRLEERGVRAEAGEGGDEERAAIVGQFAQHRIHLDGGDARDVARDREEPIGSGCSRGVLGERDSLGVATVGALDEAWDALTAGHVEYVAVGGDDVHRAVRRSCEGQKHIVQHCLCELSSFRRGQDGHQALLGVRQVLDRYGREDLHDRISSTRRASATSSARPAMMVSAVTGDTPSRRISPSWLLSRSSKTRTSSHEA